MSWVSSGKSIAHAGAVDLGKVGPELEGTDEQLNGTLDRLGAHGNDLGAVQVEPRPETVAVEHARLGFVDRIEGTTRRCVMALHARQGHDHVWLPTVP
jgi:hypothetical protein